MFAIALLRLKQGFDSPREHQLFQYVSSCFQNDGLAAFNFSPTAQKPIDDARILRRMSPGEPSDIFVGLGGEFKNQEQSFWQRRRFRRVTDRFKCRQ
jgi:hypothetical protein